MPRFERSLFAWFRGRKAAPATTGPKVVLFADCFTTYNEPAVGRAAITLLQTLGYQAILPRAGCCGRSMISTGNLAEAQRTIDRTLSRLQPHIDDPQVKAIVVAEPSCLAAMKDEWLSLKLQTPLELRQRCADKAMMLEDFVNKGWEQHPLRPAVPDQSAVGPQVLMHGHCHQKAIMGEESSAGLMRRLLGDRLKVLPSGCCGMAGSFGFLEKNLALSQQIFAQSLSGHLKNLAPDTIVLAPGTSCRHQMRDEAKIGALHPIELAAKIMCRDATGATS